MTVEEIKESLGLKTSRLFEKLYARVKKKMYIYIYIYIYLSV